VLHGRRKGKPKILKGSWKTPKGEVLYAPPMVNLRRIRGGGKVTGGRAKPYPMLAPAFNEMQRTMMQTIENEFRKIAAEATRLAKNPHKPVDKHIAGKLI